MLLPEADCAYYKFLLQNKQTGKIECFQLHVHYFGNRASLVVTIFAIKHHAELHKHKYPRAAATVLKSMIVDDNCNSVDTADEAIQLVVRGPITSETPLAHGVILLRDNVPLMTAS